MNAATASDKPLSGVRVVEISLMHAGPIATGMLGALGAELIKVGSVRCV